MSHMMLFTALPRGTSGNQLRISVFISPRLAMGGTNTTLGTLFQAPNDWPSIARKLSFGVTFGTTLTRTVTAQPDPQSANVYDSALWTTMFPAATPLYPYASAQRNTGALSSYGASTVSSHVKNVYAQAAQSPARQIVTKSTSNTLTSSATSVAAALKQTNTA